MGHRRRTAWPGLVAAIAIAGAAYACNRPPAGPITLSIVGTNDLHGGILQRDDRGGVALLGGYLANLRAARAQDGGGVVLVDAGDLFQGTLESNLNEGASVIAAYNALRYDAVAIGNHDFDFGPAGAATTPQSPADDPRGALKARAHQATFPFLTANLIDSATGRAVDWPNVKTSTVVTVAGVQAGIIGVMTANALNVTISGNVRDLRVTPLADAIAAEATRLRASGATVIVVAAHAGARCTDLSNPADASSCAPSDEIVRVAHALPRGLVDVIVAGHVHEAVAHQIDGIAISEAYSNGRAFGRVDLHVDRGTKRVVDKRSFAPRELCARVDPGTTTCGPEPPSAPRVAAEYEGAPIAPDQAVARAIAPAVEAATAQKAMPLGVTLETPIANVVRNGESALGNLFTDAFLEAVPGAEIAINNTEGGLRADLPAGPLTYGRVFAVMPFDNRLFAFHLTGAQLRAVLEPRLRGRRIPGLGGIRARVTCQGTTLNLALIRPNGKPVKDTDRVMVVTSDFLATGGERLFEPVTPPGGFTIERDGGTARDAAIAALQKRGPALRADQLIDPARPRWLLPGPAPVKCGE